jgi:hypothetical protein
MSGGLLEESDSLEGQALIAAARTSGRTSPPVNAGLDIVTRRLSICPSVLTRLQQPQALYRSAVGLSTGDREGEPQLPSLMPQSLHGLWVSLLLSRKAASAKRIKQIVRTEIVTAMNTNTGGEKTSLRIWLRMFNSAAAQRKLNKTIMALPSRYGNRAAEVSMVT